jgi:hypothetical protein
MPALARARFAYGTERLVAALAKLVKKLGAKHAEAPAWSALAEMAGALALSRTVSDGDRSTQILQNSRAMLRSRLASIQLRGDRSDLPSNGMGCLTVQSQWVVLWPQL